MTCTYDVSIYRPGTRILPNTIHAAWKKILTRVLAYSVVGAVDVCRQFITALNQTKIFFADKTPNI